MGFVKGLAMKIINGLLKLNLFSFSLKTKFISCFIVVILVMSVISMTTFVTLKSSMANLMI